MTARFRSCRRRAAAATLAATLLATLPACGDGPGAPDGEPAILVASGARLVDTIGARIPLTVVVRGAPAGEIVRFEALRTDPPPFVDDADAYVAPRDSIGYFGALATTTDSRGRARVDVMLPFLVGTPRIRVWVPALGIADTIRYTTTPGAPAGVRALPADTAVIVGTGFALRGAVVDRAGNARGETVTYARLAGPVEVSATGAVSTTTIGRAALVARALGREDTAWVSVIPRATFAAQRFEIGNGGPLGIDMLQSDGSARQRLTSGLDNEFGWQQGFSWSPDGALLALARGDAVSVVAPGIAERRLVEMQGPVFLGARWSRDGQWIYFAHAGTRTQPAGLHRVRADGSGLQALGVPSNDRVPAPSPSGQLVAYVSDRTPCGVDDCIRILDLGTGRDVAFGDRDWLAQGDMVAWSPVANRIAIASRGGRLFVARPDGTVERELGADIHQVNWMDWSPDGRWLAVSCAGPLLLIDTQTGMRLPIAQLADYGPTAWRP